MSIKRRLPQLGHQLIFFADYQYFCSTKVRLFNKSGFLASRSSILPANFSFICRQAAVYDLSRPTASLILVDKGFLCFGVYLPF